MQISEYMTRQVISLREDEDAALAARLLARHNIGAIPVCNAAGAPVGMVTDRDLVTRCVALGKKPAETGISEIMTRRVSAVDKTESVEAVLSLMGREQIRRVPVTENGTLAGIVSLSDLTRVPDTGAAAALRQISSGISRR